MSPIMCAGPGPHAVKDGVIGQCEGEPPTLSVFCTAAPCQAAAVGYTGQ